MGVGSRHAHLVADDLVTLPVPRLDTACSTSWQEALARVDRMDFAPLVPGHGAVMDRAQFRRYRRAFDSPGGLRRKLRQRGCMQLRLAA